MKLVSFFFFSVLYSLSLFDFRLEISISAWAFSEIQSPNDLIRLSDEQFFFQTFCFVLFTLFLVFFRNIIALMEHKGRDDQDEGNNFVVLVWTTKLKKSRNKKKWQGNNANMSSRVWLECYQRGSHLSRVSLGPRSRDVPYIYTL